MQTLLAYFKDTLLPGTLHLPSLPHHLSAELLAARDPHSDRQVWAGMGRACLELKDVARQSPCHDKAG